MNFDLGAPLDPSALGAAKALKAGLSDIPEGDVHHIYLHWTAAPFGCTFDDYNVMVDLKDGAWVLRLVHDPRDNMPGLNSNPMASHTWHRNSWALGIAIGGMDGATTSDFGKDPAQLHELQFLCAGAAALASKYGVQANAVTGPGEHSIMTHAECALQDGYFGERWDLAMFEPGPLTEHGARYHGDLLRQRIRQYKLAL